MTQKKACEIDLLDSVGLIGAKRTGKSHKINAIMNASSNVLVLDFEMERPPSAQVFHPRSFYLPAGPDPWEFLQGLPKKLSKANGTMRVCLDGTHFMLRTSKEMKEFASLLGSSRHVGLGIAYTSWRLRVFIDPSIRSVTEHMFIWRLPDLQDTQMAIRLWPVYEGLASLPDHSYLHVMSNGEAHLHYPDP